MLRNDLIVLLSQKDNDTVTVDVNGTHVDIDAVVDAPGGIALILQPEDLRDALSRVPARDAANG
jgi:hypothetical protein